ncbi:MAG: hypothetical protein U1E65_25715 [Myxococcota bacterium]
MSRPSTHLALLSLALGLAGCSCEGATGIGELEPHIEAAPPILNLGRVPRGVLTSNVVTVRNIGTAVVKVSQLSIVGNSIFTTTATPSFALAPSDSVPVVISARPDVVGMLSAQLVILSDDAKRSPTVVQIVLEAIDPPPCDDGNDCTLDVFDTDLAACKHSFDDGHSCQPADRCVINARCQQGVCLGEQKLCHDDSICTRDLCRQIDGECRFIPDLSACDDHNPCTADSCGPSGCEHEPLPNGTGCDDHDGCTTDDACFAGNCVGQGQPDGQPCDDGDSCTAGDTCRAGHCAGHSITATVPEGQIAFVYPLVTWDGAFIHRREVSLDDETGIFYGMDHLPLFDPPGLTHVVFAMEQCGSIHYEFSYRPPDSHVFVSHVRREMQLTADGQIRIVVGIRQTRDQGFEPQTTTYILDPEGNVRTSKIEVAGGETGRSLLPDGSHIFAVVWPLQTGPIPMDVDPLQNLVVVREDRDGNSLWRHERSSGEWAEFLGTAGPRVLFWANDNWGALDFNTGQLVWSSPTPFIADQMALSTGLNLGLARVGANGQFGFPIPTQLVGVEILEGNQVFVFPATEDAGYVPRTDPVIAADGRIILLMQRSEIDGTGALTPTGLDFVELAADGHVLTTTALPYSFADGFLETRSRDFSDDPFPTVADDGITYVGYGSMFWAIDPGGHIRWTITSTMPDAFTATVPLLREDGILLINEGNRRILGVRSNGGRMSDDGWASFRHDSRRTNYTP